VTSAVPSLLAVQRTVFSAATRTCASNTSGWARKSAVTWRAVRRQRSRSNGKGGGIHVALRRLPGEAGERAGSSRRYTSRDCFLKKEARASLYFSSVRSQSAFRSAVGSPSRGASFARTRSDLLAHRERLSRARGVELVAAHPDVHQDVPAAALSVLEDGAEAAGHVVAGDLLHLVPDEVGRLVALQPEALHRSGQLVLHGRQQDPSVVACGTRPSRRSRRGGGGAGRVAMWFSCPPFTTALAAAHAGRAPGFGLESRRVRRVRTFGKYTLLEPLASGGMADVFRAEVAGAAG